MAGTEQVFARSPGAQPGSRIIAAPFEFYTTGEDNLRITSFCSVAGTVLELHLRTIDNAGKINAHRHVHTPNSDRTAKSDDTPLGVGAVMNITTFATAGSPKIGQVFVIVQLIRGLGTAAIVLGTLLQGYVTQRQALGWPGSPIQSSFDGEPPVLSTLTNVPIPGGDWHIEPPAGARWEVLSAFAGFVTAGGAATRTAFLQVSRGGAFAMLVSPFMNQVAGQGITYTWGQNLPYSVNIGAGFVNQPLPYPAIIGPSDQIGVLTTGITVFDQWGAGTIAYREWLEAQV